MKAILWKELRENFRWALLGCLLLTLAEFYILAGLQQEIQNGSSANITLTDASFLMVVLFGRTLVAVCLAAVQILPERSRDRWAALLHRPVSRGVIFWGKAIAGLGLYAAAVLPPFLAGACYVAWPGKFPAPFVAGLLLAGFHALAGGVGLYFGSLLLCLHRGRWPGTRGILLLAVGAVFLLQMKADGLFLILPLVTASVLSLAAWHTMLGEGSAERWASLRRACFVCVVLVGAQGGLLLVGSGLSLLSKPKRLPAFAYTQLEVTQEGQVLKTSSDSNGEGAAVTDLAGKPVTDERYVGNDRRANLCQFWPLSYGLHRPRIGSFPAPRNLLLGINYVQAISLGNRGRESWFLLIRQNYLIGYDNLSRRCVGICDREGFKAPGAKPVPFESPLKHDFFYREALSWFWTDHRLYAISFPDRELKSFFDLPGNVIEEVLPMPIEGLSGNFRYVVLALENGIQVLDERGQSAFARSYLHDSRRWSMVAVATNPAVDRLFVQSQSGWYSVTAEYATDVEYVDELDLHGNLLHDYSATIDNTLPPDPLWLTTAAACLLPLVPAVLVETYRHVVPVAPADEDISIGHNARAINLAGWIGMTLSAVVLAAVAFVWARRVGFTARRARGWAVFVLVFGPAGLLTFRLAAGWPERVRCPFCGHLRGLSQDTCPHCQRAWSTPQPAGTEIFQMG